MASIADFRKTVKTVAKTSKVYKDYLSIALEEQLPWYSASKMVMEYLHSGEKLTADDYKDINKLRKWYTDQLTETSEEA